MDDFKFPFALDKAENKSSVTLFFAYISFLLTAILIIVMSCQLSLNTGLIASFVLFLISIFFYRARKIDTLKISKSGFEIGDNEPDNKTKKPVISDDPPESA